MRSSLTCRGIAALLLAIVSAAAWPAGKGPPSAAAHPAQQPTTLGPARTVAAAVPAAAAALQAQATEQQAAIDKYTARSKELSDKAKAYEQSYDAMNYRDDQFDMADVFLSIAMAVIGVSALIESWPLLLLGLASASVGALMVAAGFAGWGLHSEWLASLLG